MRHRNPMPGGETVKVFSHDGYFIIRQDDPLSSDEQSARLALVQVPVIIKWLASALKDAEPEAADAEPRAIAESM